MQAWDLTAVGQMLPLDDLDQESTLTAEQLRPTGASSLQLALTCS
jgi:hypothetical protein